LLTHNLIQRRNSAPYVANRIAKLVLELLWHTISTLHARPTPNTGILTSTAIAVHFAQVDSILTAALQLAFSRKRSLVSLQYHSTQLELLRASIEVYPCVPEHWSFFKRATEWLTGQVEKERHMAANRFYAVTGILDVMHDGDDV
jgi:hypothetical protein